MGAARAVPAGQLPLPPALPAAAGQLLDQARRALAEASLAPDPRQRYATAHLGALRAAAAVLAARTRPEPARRRPRSAWVLLGQVAYRCRGSVQAAASVSPRWAWSSSWAAAAGSAGGRGS